MGIILCLCGQVLTMMGKNRWACLSHGEITIRAEDRRKRHDLPGVAVRKPRK